MLRILKNINLARWPGRLRFEAPPYFPLVYILLFAGGVGAVQLLPALPPLSWALAAAAVCALAAGAASVTGAGAVVSAAGAVAGEAGRAGMARRGVVFLALAAALFLAGSGYALARVEARLAAALPPELVWQDIVIEGVVEDFPVSNARRTRFDFAIERIVAPREVTLNMKARIADYHRGRGGEVKGRANDAVSLGNRLRMKVRLRPPQISANPHNFDFASYLLRRDIHLTGYVRDKETITLLEDGGGVKSFAAKLLRPAHWRRALRERIYASDVRQPGFIAALLIGDRSGLTARDWDVLQRSGTAHLVSVSGVHIGLIILLVTLLFGGAWRLNMRLTTALPATAAALLLSLVFAFFYAQLAGFAAPVQRSFVMAVTVALAILAGGKSALGAGLGAALLFVLLLDPWAVVAPGFWLSFLTTAFVLAAVTAAGSGGGWGWKILGLHVHLAFVIAPLTLWFFNEASLISPLANALAVPLVGFWALPLAFAGALLGEWCWQLADWGLAFMWWFLQKLSALPAAVAAPAAPPFWLLALAIGGAFYFLLPRAVPGRLAGLMPIAAMLLWAPPPPPDGEAVMTVLDVGQGAAVVLETRRHVVVYDTGRVFGGAIVSNYLRGRGISRVDKLILSHDDDDHRGGAAVLARNVNIAETVASDGDSQCAARQQWQYDGVRFTFLHPPPPSPHYRAPDNDNDKSCVLLLENAAGRRALLTGDISAAVEERLPLPGAAEVLLVAHHGSRSSSSAEFLRRAGADVAVISVGRNYYNHPHAQTLARLAAAGSKVYRTDEHGAVIINLGDSVSVRPWREENKRYWYAYY